VVRLVVANSNPKKLTSKDATYYNLFYMRRGVVETGCEVQIGFSNQYNQVRLR